LGDLSGGLILARVARRALHLDKDGEGLAFYKFSNIDSPKRFKDRYRTALNSLPLTDEQIQAMVQEANVAFLLNMRLFEELDVLGGVPNAKVRSLQDVYEAAAATNKKSGNATALQDESQQAPCPFAKTGAATSGTDTKHSSSGKTCPWPFILLHDPAVGMRKWQTWLVVGLFLTFCYQKIALGWNEKQLLPTPQVSGASLVDDHVEMSRNYLVEDKKSIPQQSDHAIIHRPITFSQIYENWNLESN
jgi:hypothetical protein